MTDRISDERLALLEAALGKIENDYRPTCISPRYGSGCPGPTDESREFWRCAVDCLPAMIAELRGCRELIGEIERIRSIPDTDWSSPRNASETKSALIADAISTYRKGEQP